MSTATGMSEFKRTARRLQVGRGRLDQRLLTVGPQLEHPGPHQHQIVLAAEFRTGPMPLPTAAGHLADAEVRSRDQNRREAHVATLTVGYDTRLTARIFKRE